MISFVSKRKPTKPGSSRSKRKVRKTSWTETAIASFSRFAMWWRNRNAKHQADLNVPQHLDPSHRGQATMLKPPIGIGTSEKCVNMIREWIDIAMMFEITTLESKSGNKPIGSDCAQLAAQKTQLDSLLTMAVNSCKAQEALVKELNIGVADLNKQLQELRHKLDMARLLLARAESGAPTRRLSSGLLSTLCWTSRANQLVSPRWSPPLNRRALVAPLL